LAMAAIAEARRTQDSSRKSEVWVLTNMLDNELECTRSYKMAREKLDATLRRRLRRDRI
jgi:hypothetical protein